MKEHYDLVIVGAGPAGISCAIEAGKQDLNYLLCDKGNIVNSIINFPTDMTFFSTADQLELGNIPFNCQNFRPTRTEAVRYYQRLVNYFSIPVATNLELFVAKKSDGLFVMEFRQQGDTKELTAKNVIVATGFYDQPNRLGIPGEELDHVSHYYREAFPYYNQSVIVVGGKNSAVEAALDLFRSGVKVSIVHRRPEIKASVKYWILPDIQNRIREGSIQAYLNSQLEMITPRTVQIKHNGKVKSLPADAVFLLTGYHPDENILKKCDVKYDRSNMEPEINQETLESNIPGLYLAGSIIAGKNANRIFIENSRDHGKIIVSAIMRNQSSG